MLGYGRPTALASYGRIANAELDPIQQIVMLYDGAIKFLRLAATNIEEHDIHAKAEHTSRAIDIISYLQSILDFERGGDVAPVLDALYSNVLAITLRASVRLDPAQMHRAADLLLPVRESWATNAQANALASAALSANNLSNAAANVRHSAMA